MNAFVNVVRAELFKVRRKRRTYVVAGLWWVLLPVLALIVGRVLLDNLGSIASDLELGGIDAVIQQIASPFGIARLALVGPAYVSPTFYVIVVALLAALLVGDDRTHAMWKTVLVVQPSRLAVLAGKVTVGMLVVGALMAGAVIAGLAFGALGTTFLPTDFSGEWGQLLLLYALQWAFTTALVALAYLMVYVTRNVALGLVLVFFLPALLEGLYTVYAAVVGFQPINRFNAFLQAIRMRQVLEDLPTYFFTTNVYAPARSTTRELVATFGAEASGNGGPDLSALLGSGITLGHAAWVVAGYTVVLFALLVWRFLRTDVD
ncbi:MAG: ABC transporter permease [Trueperaceae bacterium]|nr:ABC transporter permease [Trueperaceae bacterium]